MGKRYSDVTKEVTDGTLFRTITITEHDTDFVVREEQRLMKHTADWPTETANFPAMRFPSYKEAEGEADRCFKKNLANGFIPVNESF